MGEHNRWYDERERAGWKRCYVARGERKREEVTYLPDNLVAKDKRF